LPSTSKEAPQFLEPAIERLETVFERHGSPC